MEFFVLFCFGVRVRMTLSEGGRLLSEGGKSDLGFFARRVFLHVDER
jgi:hypothetical protein